MKKNWVILIVVILFCKGSSVLSPEEEKIIESLKQKKVSVVITQDGFLDIFFGKKDAKIDGNEIKELAKLQNKITKFGVGISMHLKSEMYADIGLLSSLKELKILKYNEPDKIDFSFLSKLTKLDKMDISMTSVNEEECKIIGSLNNLTSLQLYENSLSNQCIAALAGLKKLKDLDLRRNPEITVSPLKEIVLGMPNLRTITLAETAVTDEEGQAMVEEYNKKYNLSSMDGLHLERMMPSSANP